MAARTALTIVRFRRRMHTGKGALVGALIVAVALAGCSKAQPKATDATTTPAPTTAATSSAAATTSAPSATPTATVSAQFNGTCYDFLPVTKVEGALARPLTGKSAFIVGIAEPDIGRQAYLNCKYGIVTKTVNKKKVQTVALEIGISLYGTAQQAAARVSGTVDDYRNSGATQASVPVGQYSGTVLTGYGEPTLVVAAGPRTVAVSMSPTLVSAAARATSLAAVANVALASSTSFTQGGPAAVPGSTVSAASGTAAPTATSS